MEETNIVKDYTTGLSDFAHWNDPKFWEEAIADGWERKNGILCRVADPKKSPLHTETKDAKASVEEELLYECVDCATIGPGATCPFCNQVRPRYVERAVWYDCKRCYCEGPTPTCGMCGKPRPPKPITQKGKLDTTVANQSSAQPQLQKWHENFISPECSLTGTHHKCGNYHCKCECHDRDAGIEVKIEEKVVKEDKPLDDEAIAYYCDMGIRNGDKSLHVKCSGWGCQCDCHILKAAKLPYRHFGTQCKKAFPKHSLCDDIQCECPCHDVKADAKVLAEVAKPQTQLKERPVKCTWMTIRHDEWRCETHSAVYTGVYRADYCPVYHKLDREYRNATTPEKVIPIGSVQDLEYRSDNCKGTDPSYHKICADHRCYCDCHNLKSASGKKWLCVGCKGWKEETFNISGKCKVCRDLKKKADDKTTQFHCRICTKWVDSDQFSRATWRCVPCSRDVLSKSTKWECPTCKEWIEESMHKECYQCRQKKEGNPQSDKQLIEEAESKGLTDAERDELYWATGRNYYPHKGPKRALPPAVILNGPGAVNLDEFEITAARVDIPQEEEDIITKRTRTLREAKKAMFKTLPEPVIKLS